MLRNSRIRLQFIRGILLAPALAALGWGVAHRENISAVAPPAPTATAQSGPVAVYFSRPQTFDGEYAGGPDEALVASIDRAVRTVDIASYDFDLLSAARALLRAKNRGVRIRIVVDSDNWRNEALDFLRGEGIPVVGDGREGLMHDKFVVIDGGEVWAGSMNLTVNDAYRNDNNLLRILSADLARIFTTEFEEMFAAKKFGSSSPSGTTPKALAAGSGTIEALFAPEDGVASRVIREIRAARRSIHFLAFSFTSGEIAAAMMDRLPDGLALFGVLEDAQARSNSGAQFGALEAAGATVYLDANPRNMHHKVIVLDGSVVITGSYNFTGSAENKNDEDLLIIRSPELAAAFEAEFRRVFNQAAGTAGS
jgi:phosphatidylserine/phosphatidylglycerophosphate/cardiolipin synthase-like enzyme